MPTKIGNLFDRLLNGFAIAAGFLMIFVMLIVTADVSTRYLLRSPITGVQEITEIALLYIGFLSFAWLLRKEGHVTMDLVMNRLSPRTQSLLTIITSVLGALVFAVLTYYGARTTWDHFQAGLYTPTAIQFPNAPILVVIPFGSCLLFVQFLRRTDKQFRRWKSLKGEGGAPPLK